jgi:hypothetical protein
MSPERGWPYPHQVADQRNEVREDYRMPTERERAILYMLLSVETPGIEDLRAQARRVRVARWSCGFASFNIEVDRTGTPQSQLTKRPAVEAFTKQRDDPQRALSKPEAKFSLAASMRPESRTRSSPTPTATRSRSRGLSPLDVHRVLLRREPT